MLLRRERTLLLGIAAVLFLAAVMSVRQVLENQSRHAEMREAFILSHERGHTADAQRLYDRLKYDMPEDPTRHLINDLERTAVRSDSTAMTYVNSLLMITFTTISRQVNIKVSLTNAFHCGINDSFCFTAPMEATP